MIIKGKMEKIDTICGVDIMSVDNNMRKREDPLEEEKKEDVTSAEVAITNDVVNNKDIQPNAKDVENKQKKQTSSLRSMHF